MHDLWEYVLQPSDEGKKYQEILKRKFHFSTKLLQVLKQGEKVWINGQFTYLNARGHAGETLTIKLLDSEDFNIPGENLPLEILYEDNYLLAVSKPPGQVVHPTPRHPQGTLGNAVVGYWNSKGEKYPFRPVNRIDRNTSGIVVIAKNRFSHQQLAWQSQNGLIKKHYLGFVEGNLKASSGIIDKPIALSPGSFIVREINEEGLPSLTHFEVLKTYLHASLLRFTLGTGRTHQIRIHCQSIGHPLIGDDLYSGSRNLIQRQALHSFQYSFTHPATGDYKIIRAPMPSDLIHLMMKLKQQK